MTIHETIVKLDAIDQKLLHELQINGRISNVALAEQVHLSTAACLRRVRNLEESGLIKGFVALVDQSIAGYPEDVFVQITLNSQQKLDLLNFEQEVIKHPEVMECYLMSGPADYLLRVIVADARDYERLHSEYLTSLPGVDRVQSNFALRTVVKRTEIKVANGQTDQQT